MSNQFQEVFDVHPDAEKLYVVGDMPFLSLCDAETFSRSNGNVNIKEIAKGPSEKEAEAAAAKAEQKAKAAAAKAEKEAKAAAAKAEKEAKAAAKKGDA